MLVPYCGLSHPPTLRTSRRALCPGEHRHVNDPSKLAHTLSKGGPIGLKRARLNAHRPQCNHTSSLVWALGEHKRPTGQLLIPSASTRTDQAALPHEPFEAGPSMASVIWNAVPFPSVLSTVIVPPCASTTSFTIFVPSPVPPTFRLIAWYENRLSRTSGDMPLPVSITDSTTCLPDSSGRPRTVTDPPDGTSGIALFTRL
jgi:hypothetical protein